MASGLCTELALFGFSDPANTSLAATSYHYWEKPGPGKYCTRTRDPEVPVLARTFLETSAESNDGVNVFVQRILLFTHTRTGEAPDSTLSHYQSRSRIRVGHNFELEHAAYGKAYDSWRLRGGRVRVSDNSLYLSAEDLPCFALVRDPLLCPCKFHETATPPNKHAPRWRAI